MLLIDLIKFTIKTKLNRNDKKQKNLYYVKVFFVRVKGLEPPSRKALDPKSSVSTNFTTPAVKFYWGKYNQVFMKIVF